MLFNSPITLATQALSYQPEGVTLQAGEVRLFTAHNGRCSVCGCSAFRHALAKLYIVICKHPCPATTMRAYNSEDLASLSLPQICDPDTKVPKQPQGPIVLELQENVTGEGFRLEAPVVTLPRLEGPVTQATREVLHEMQDRRCNGCFRQLPLEDLTDDHRVPRSRGGLKEVGNIELMCAPCNNQEKGSEDMYTFLWARHRHVITGLLPTLI